MSQNMKMIDQATLKELLIYDCYSGKLFWKERPQSFFPTYKSFRQWNGAWAGKEAFTATDKKGYKVGAIFNKGYKAHRIIWIMVYGFDPIEVDHINGIKSDNGIFNLRNVTPLENRKNMGIQKNSKSGVTGVSWAKRENKWKAAITIKGKQICLGYFDEIEYAIKMRKQAEEIHGFHVNHGKAVRNG